MEVTEPLEEIRNSPDFMKSYQDLSTRIANFTREKWQLLPALAYLDQADPDRMLTWEMTIRKLAFEAEEKGNSQEAQWYDLKGDWIKFWMENPRKRKKVMGKVTTALRPNPFRITKQELNDPKMHPNDIGPMGRQGLPRGLTSLGYAIGEKDFVPASALKKAKSKTEVSELYAELLREKLSHPMEK